MSTRGTAAPATAVPDIAKAFSVEIACAGRLADVRADWTDLLTRAAEPNAFMDPALIAAAHDADPSGGHRALLAWTSVDGRKRLAGLWAFSVGRPRRSMLPLPVMRVPAFSHSYLATPVIDRDCLDETLDAMLEGVAESHVLPKIMSLDPMGTGGPTYEALVRVLTTRSSLPCVFEQGQRPKLASELDGKAYLEQALSSSTRKKLRQHRRKLSEKGTLASSIATEPDAVRKAVDEFLTMEAAGWKGRQGTALASNEAEAAFMRSVTAALAERNSAAVHSIHLDGKPVSMQIVVRAGAAAFTWKTAYDEAFQDFSPGMLLLEDYTAAFLADKSISFVDSCSFDATGFMSAWQERQAVADVWIDARRGGSLEFRALSGLQKTYREARAAAKAAYLRWQKARKA
ncbi:MAG: GNAT family N-acetyltransferase [Xanthobacteraceae bacterium]|nr:GNAT family N-acetyltransferase [Xanthobacteraceae bacterium]